MSGKARPKQNAKYLHKTSKPNSNYTLLLVIEKTKQPSEQYNNRGLGRFRRNQFAAIHFATTYPSPGDISPPSSDSPRHHFATGQSRRRAPGCLAAIPSRRRTLPADGSFNVINLHLAHSNFQINCTHS